MPILHGTRGLQPRTTQEACTNSDFKGTKPGAVFKRHFLTCFIADAFGLKNIDAIARHDRL